MKLASIVGAMGILALQNGGQGLGVLRGATPSVPVTVVNGAGQPVPTTVNGTPNVHVVSMPQVVLAGAPDVHVVSMPQVQLAGIPSVNVANFPPGQGAGTTVLVSTQAATLSTLDVQALNPVDVSAYRDVRVVANGLGTADFKAYVYVVDESGLGRNLLLEDDIVGGTGGGTRLYVVPGRQITFLLLGPSSGQANVTISVYGRS